MLLAKSLQDLVDATRVPYPDLALPLPRYLRPAGLGEGTIHVPLDEGNLVLREQAVQNVEKMIADLLLGEVQHELVAALGPRAVGEVVNPVGVLPVEVGIRIDHLRFDPQAEAHAKGMDLLDQLPQAPRKLLLVDPPVAQAPAVVVPFAEPTVVQDEEFDTQRSCLLRKATLNLLTYVEVGGLPRVVEHWTGAFVRQHVFTRVAVKVAAGLPEPPLRVAADERGGLEGLTAFEVPGEVEVVYAARDL